MAMTPTMIEPRPAGSYAAEKTKNFAMKPPVERQSREAEHEQPHGDAEERPLPAEARQVVERHRLSELALACRDDGERAERSAAYGTR